MIQFLALWRLSLSAVAAGLALLAADLSAAAWLAHRG
jgi:hypothetical protein